MSELGKRFEFAEGNTVGIDLGTSCSALAHLDEDGDPVIVESATGSPVTPSIVVLGEGGRVLVGPSSDRLLQEDPERVIVAIKREMGNPNFAIEFEQRQLTPELISSLILMKVRKDAESQIGPVANAVITVPYYFNNPCREATQNAGQIAGLNVIDIINEPTAATLAYVWERGELGRADLPDVEKTILVYDLGGGTFDVTLVRHTPTHFSVVGTDGDTRLGGLDWTQRIADHYCEEFRTQFGLDPREDSRSRIALFNVCEEVKRELSVSLVADVNFEYRGQSLSLKMTRYEFEDLTADLLQRTRDTTEFVMDNAAVPVGQLDEIVLVGGSTCMPSVQTMLTEVCERAPSHMLNPQLAVAQGAAIHAAILEVKHTAGKGRMADALLRRLRAVTTTDVNSHSLGVEITNPNDSRDKQNHIMIPRNSTLPRGVKQRFVTTLDNPNAIHIRLLEGESADVNACTFIGDLRLTNLPDNLTAGSPIEVTYSYNERGHIEVTVRELVGKTEGSVEIAWNGGMNLAAIESLRALAGGYHVE